MKYLKIKEFSTYSLGLFLFLLLTSFNHSDSEKAEPQKINWLTIEEAQELAEENPKKVIMDVYTDWCGWCKKMDKTTFADEEVAAYVNENFYAVKLKADSNDKVTFKGQEFTKGELARALRVTGYPTVVFFDESLGRFQPVSGFRPADDFLKLLEAFHEAEMNQ
ncbi:MAG: thioredoxin fold domain-containing protein [Bacteroidota bacterium]